MRTRIALIAVLLVVLAVGLFLRISSSAPSSAPRSSGEGSAPLVPPDLVNLPGTSMLLEIDVDSAITRENALNITYAIRSLMPLESLKDAEERAGVFRLPDDNNQLQVIEGDSEAEHDGTWTLRRSGNAVYLSLLLP